MLTTATSPRTLREMLFADDRARVVVADRLEEADATTGLGRLGAAARSAVRDRLVDAVEGVCDLDVADLLVAGWCGHRALHDAAERTRAAPGTEEVVDLATHRIRSEHRPALDLVVDGVAVASVAVTVTLTCTLVGLAATVCDGRLVAVGGGRATAEAALALEGRTVLERERTFDVHLVVHLDGGYPLLAVDRADVRGP